MKLGQAIKTALEYEIGVHKVYLDAMEQTADEAAKRVFEVLGAEETGHISYLRSRLDEWQKTGHITLQKLETAIPKKAAIDKGLNKLRKTVKPKPTVQTAELQVLKRALEVEIQTSNFYEEMVRTLDGDGKKLFERFVEIEMGHQAIVQAEIDSVTGLGFWFDTEEFRLEEA
jgi:rubrerythrin